MKITFELPTSLVTRLRAYVPTRKRSKWLADVIEKELPAAESELAKAARKANTLESVNEEMKAWEALNGYDDSKG